MKKVFLVAALAALIGGMAFAFDPTSYPEPIEDSLVALNLGIGFGSGYYSYLDMKIPPLMLTADFRVPIGGLPFSAGGFFGMSQYGWGYVADDWTFTTLVFGGRFNYHLNFEVPKLDVYGGVSLGWRMGLWDDAYKQYWDYPGSAYSLNVSEFYFGFQAGARYFFIPNVGAFIEAGYGLTYIKLGATFKF